MKSSVMSSDTLSPAQEKADRKQAPASAPATARVIFDRAKASGEPENPPPPERPDFDPQPAPETDPALEPEIPPVETPSISRG